MYPTTFISDLELVLESIDDVAGLEEVVRQELLASSARLSLTDLEVHTELAGSHPVGRVQLVQDLEASTAREQFATHREFSTPTPRLLFLRGLVGPEGVLGSFFLAVLGCLPLPRLCLCRAMGTSSRRCDSWTMSIIEPYLVSRNKHK